MNHDVAAFGDTVHRPAQARRIITITISAVQPAQDRLGSLVVYINCMPFRHDDFFAQDKLCTVAKNNMHMRTEHD